MKHTEDIIFRLLQIKEATKLANSPTMSEDNIDLLRDIIIENRRHIPSFALSHFDRLEASGVAGIAQLNGNKCSGCDSTVEDDEITYLQENKNIGVCDHCFAFIYLPDEKFNTDDIFKDFV